MNDDLETVPSVCPPFDSRRDHVLYTKAAILSTRGRVELGVKIDGSSIHNLLLRLIASRLRLPLLYIPAEAYG